MHEGLVEKIMAVCAVVIAAVAVIIAVYELHSTREYQRLSVAPYLMLANYRDNGYDLVVINNGLGPAKIMGVEVRVEGQPVKRWVQVVDRFLGEGHGKSFVYSSLGYGRQIVAGERVNALHMDSDELGNRFQLNTSKLDVILCYCSIYKECWISRYQGDEPEAVSSCPAMPRYFPG